MLSQRLLPALLDDVPVPVLLLPLEVVPVPALLGSELPELVALGLELGLEVAELGLELVELGLELEVEPLAPVPLLALPAVPVSPLRVELPLVVALGLVVLVPEPLTPVLLEAPVPALVPDVPVPMVPLEAPVLDLLVAPEPLSEAQPAPKATSAATVAAASSFTFIRILLLDRGVRARCAPGLSKTYAAARERTLRRAAHAIESQARGRRRRAARRRAICPPPHPSGLACQSCAGKLRRGRRGAPALPRPG